MKTPAQLKAEYDMRQDQLRAIIPNVIGMVNVFEAHGAKFICKKSTANTWSLWRSGDNGIGVDRNTSVRFGSLEEIRDDVSYVLDIGALPPRTGGMW